MADTEPKRPSKDPKKAYVRPSVERAEALRDVLTHAVAVEKESRKRTGPPKTGIGRTLSVMLSVPVMVFSVYSYAARPEFVWGPNPANETIARKDANLRFKMYLLSQRIRSQLAATGRLPATLDEARDRARGIAYSVVSDTVFELRAEEDGQALVLRSDKPAVEFLGDAQRHIQGRSK